MLDLPPKPSMASYAQGVIRALLAKGEWMEKLPGERALALRVGVSRPTLHEALEGLEAEGLIEKRAKSAWRIRATAVAAPVGVRKVVFLSPLSLEDLDHFTLHQYAVLSSHLAERGYEVEPVRLRVVQGVHPESALKSLATRLRPSAWILHRCSPVTHQWFGQSGLPVVVMGSAPARLRIRSVDVDYRAAARHAVSLLMRLGHRPDQVAYLMPTEKLLGHAEAVAGMREAGGKSPQDVRVVPTPDRPEALCGQVDRLWREARRPTALILHRPLQALTILGHLARRGVRVPEDVSLVVLDDNPMLAHVVPHPARYHKDTGQFAAHLRKAIEHAVAHSAKGARSTRIVPELIAGDTLGKPPGNGR